MDMNWQAMLREAADASFEKNIEALAVADNDAYSCVDLSQSKIWELSKKILLLPHPGIVLLFSRYCFQLSPEEIEMFFQLKNAKGAFRFYRSLLSSCMGLAQNQIISDNSFAKACKAALKEYLRTELKEDMPDSTMGKNRKRNFPFRKIGKAVAVVAITATLLFSTVMVANAELREKVITWVIETFEKYSIFELKSSGDDALPDLTAYKATYIPDGFVLLDTIEQPEVVQYEYAVNDSNFFSISISQSFFNVYADTENTEIKLLTIDGVTGYFFEKDSLSYICFERDGLYFSVYGSANIDELIMVASGITKTA